MTRIKWLVLELIAGIAACLAAWFLLPFCVAAGLYVVSAVAAYAAITK